MLTECDQYLQRFDPGLVWLKSSVNPNGNVINTFDIPDGKATVWVNGCPEVTFTWPRNLPGVTIADDGFLYDNKWARIGNQQTGPCILRNVICNKSS